MLGLYSSGFLVWVLTIWYSIGLFLCRLGSLSAPISQAQSLILISRKMGDLKFWQIQDSYTLKTVHIYLETTWIRVLLDVPFFQVSAPSKNLGSFFQWSLESSNTNTPPFVSLRRVHCPSERAPWICSSTSCWCLQLPFLQYLAWECLPPTLDHEVHSSFYPKTARRGCGHLPGEAGQATWAHPMVNSYIIYSINLFI